MSNLQKSNAIISHNINKIRSFTIGNSEELLDLIGNAVGKNLSLCNVASISHSLEVKAIITKNRSEVKLKEKERPGNKLVFKDEPKELHGYSYYNLRTIAQEDENSCHGILYGTIKLHHCEKEIDCPKCSGTGICVSCGGNKQVICPVCDGNRSCVQCDGTGKYTCRACNGSGVCQECDDGWYTCDECGGSGIMTCPDCGGSGDYINETCNKCYGNGYYGRKLCRACNGTGQYVKQCARCDGGGNTSCGNCDGEGGWSCEECHGTGSCSHCRGRGWFTCKACDGSGKCGKCKGKGKVWCPDCQGKGICFECQGNKKVICPRCNGLGEYQTFIEYSFTREKQSINTLCSLPVNKSDISSILGDECYKGILYEFFAKKAIVFNKDSVLSSLQGKLFETVKEWIDLNHFLPYNTKQITNDYLKVFIELFSIPVTKVILEYKSKTYLIYIVGNNLDVYYDSLPGFFSLLWGHIKKRFGKN